MNKYLLFPAFFLFTYYNSLSQVEYFRSAVTSVDVTQAPFITGITAGAAAVDQTRVVNTVFASGLPGPNHIMLGKDGTFYVTAYSSAKKITPDGTVTGFTYIEDADAMVQGQDGNIYVVERNTGSIQKISPDGTVSTFNAGPFSLPQDIMQGKDGNFYVLEAFALKAVTQDGSIDSLFFGGLRYTVAIDQGTDGSFYVAEGLYDRVRKITADGTSSVIFATFPRNTRGIVASRDGYIYVIVGVTGGKIWKVAPDGTQSLYAEGLNTPLGLVQAWDGDFYTVENTPGNVIRMSEEYALTIDEHLPDNTIVASVEAVDPNGDSLSYLITEGNTAGAFAINPAGEIIVNDAGLLDYETTTFFTLTVVATDGTHTSQFEDIEIQLKDLDDLPVITEGQQFHITEDAPNGTKVGTAAATDPNPGTTLAGWAIVAGNADDIFGIDSLTGEITVADNTNLDRETTPACTLQLTVSDGINTSAAVVL